MRLPKLSQIAPYSHARTKHPSPSDAPGARSRRDIATALAAAQTAHHVPTSRPCSPSVALEFLWTIPRPPHRHERSVCLDHPRRRVPDTCVLSVSAPTPEPSCLCRRAPPWRGSPPATIHRPPSIRFGLCEVHVTNKRVQTNTCSAFSADPADSNAQALRSNTPAVAEAARLWPKASNGRPHRQLRTERRRGKRSLRRMSTRKGAELILER